MSMISVGGFVIPRDKFIRLERMEGFGDYYRIHFKETKNGWFSTYEEEVTRIIPMRHVTKVELDELINLADERS